MIPVLVSVLMTVLVCSPVVILVGLELANEVIVCEYKVDDEVESTTVD